MRQLWLPATVEAVLGAAHLLGAPAQGPVVTSDLWASSGLVCVGLGKAGLGEMPASTCNWGPEVPTRLLVGGGQDQEASNWLEMGWFTA